MFLKEIHELICIVDMNKRTSMKMNVFSIRNSSSYIRAGPRLVVVFLSSFQAVHVSEIVSVFLVEMRIADSVTREFIAHELISDVPRHADVFQEECQLQSRVMPQVCFFVKIVGNLQHARR